MVSVTELVAAPCTADGQINVRLASGSMVVVPVVCLRLAAIVDVADVVPDRLRGAMPRPVAADVDSLLVAAVTFRQCQTLVLGLCQTYLWNQVQTVGSYRKPSTPSATLRVAKSRSALFLDSPPTHSTPSRFSRARTLFAAGLSETAWPARNTCFGVNVMFTLPVSSSKTAA